MKTGTLWADLVLACPVLRDARDDQQRLNILSEMLRIPRKNVYRHLWNTKRPTRIVRLAYELVTGVAA